MRRMIRSLSVWVLVLASLTLPPLAGPELVLAADATVTTCDENNFDAALAAVQGSGGGTITFACGGTIFFSGQKTISSDVTIVGGGSVTFDGQGATRLFRVNLGASLSLDGLTLQNGNAGAFEGGAILNNLGSLDIRASTFSGNNAGQSGGAIFSTASTLTVRDSTFSGNNADNTGGAIFHANGVATVTNSTFTGNVASSGGGALYSGGHATRRRQHLQ